MSRSESPTPHCLHCGYNLTGVCTEQRPNGACPECGAAFDRGRVIEVLSNQYLTKAEIVIVLALMPALSILIFLLFAGLAIQASSLPVWSVTTATILLLLLSAAGAAGFVAAQLQATARLYENRPAFIESSAWLWLLLFLIEVVVTFAYAFGGMALLR